MKNKAKILLGLFFCFGFNLQAQEHDEGEGALSLEKHEEVSKIKDFSFIEKNRSLLEAKVNNFTGIPNVEWKERGPKNLGGVVTCMMYDPNDSTAYKKVWAGSENGGLWYNNDITSPDSVWRVVDDMWEAPSIASITSDPSNKSIFYAVTGVPNRAEPLYGDAAKGVGIYKSIDKGKNWVRLESTIPSIYPQFLNIGKIKVNAFGTVFVSTTVGLLKSVDGGKSWTTTLGAWSLFDIEIDSDGRMYVGTNYPSDGKIFKSFDNGVSWVDISPQNTTLRGSAVQIAIAKNQATNKQIIHTMYFYKYNETKVDLPIWYYKSENAGDPLTSGSTSWVSLLSNLNSPAALDLGNRLDHIRSYRENWASVLEIDPKNTQLVFQAGVGIWRSYNGGLNYQNSLYQNRNYDHVDYHAILFNPRDSTCVIATDGGIYFSRERRRLIGVEYDKLVPNPNGGCCAVNTIVPGWNSGTKPRNLGLNITQAPTLSQKNVINDNAILFSTWHNNNYLIDNLTLNGNIATTANIPNSLGGGEAQPVFFDQDEPNLYIFGNIIKNITLIDTQYFDLRSNLLDYDSHNNILYSAEKSGTLIQIVKHSNVGNFSISSLNKTIIFTLPATYTVDWLRGKLKYKNNKLFFAAVGLNKLLKYDLSTNTFSEIQISGAITNPIKDISFGANENEILMSIDGFGQEDNLWFTNNGGTSWVSKHKEIYGLPKTAIYAVVANPNNPKQVLVGTEYGVWGTNDITLSSPNWQLANTQLANVRCTKFNIRSVDNNLLVGTNSRGIFSSNVFTNTNQCKSNVILSNLKEASNFVSSNWIKSTSNISGSTNNVKYYASRIELNPGFRVGSGAAFRTVLDPCAPGARKRSNEETKIVSEMKETVIDVFPNPVEKQAFNINYKITSKGLYSIKIKTIVGSNLLTVFENKEIEPGNYSEYIDNASLSAGLYYCTLEAPDFVQSKKIVVR